MRVFKRIPAVLKFQDVDMKDFDWEIYLLNYPELVAKGIRSKNDAYNHYRRTGHLENRTSQIPSSFNAERYIRFHGHLGLKTPREAYIHYMRIGKVVKRNEGQRRTAQPYRVPAATSQSRRPVSNTKVAAKQNKPPVTIHPLPNPFQRPRRVVQPVIVKSHTPTIMKQPHRRVNQVTPSLFSFHGKRNVKQPKPGELVLRESPSSYFARLGVLGPPRYVNRQTEI